MHEPPTRPIPTQADTAVLTDDDLPAPAPPARKPRRPVLERPNPLDYWRLRIAALTGAVAAADIALHAPVPELHWAIDSYAFLAGIVLAGSGLFAWRDDHVTWRRTQLPPAPHTR